MVQQGAPSSFQVVDDGLTITATYHLPGLREDQVHIKVENGLLTIRLESEHRSERFGEGLYQQSMTVPPHITEQDIQTEWSHGLLTIRIPKN